MYQAANLKDLSPITY